MGRFYFHKGLVLFAGVLVAAGCASKPKNEVAVDTTTSAPTQIARTEAELMSLKNESADVLAPDSYQKAEKAVKKAKELGEKPGSREKTLEQVALAQAWAADTRDQAQASQNRLKPVLEARKFAMQANAPNLFPSRWKDAEEQLSRAARSAREKSGSLSDKIVDLDRTYMILEKDAVAKNSLDPARQTLDKARKEGANTYAPRTLKEAQLQFDQSLAAIRGAPRNELQTQQAAVLAQQKADLALEVTRRARANPGDSSEDLIRNNIAVQTRARDLAAASALAESQRAEAEERAANLEGELADAESQATNLPDQAEEIRQTFEPNEADVYVQGNNIIIRVKGLSFASGKSEVASAQYPLLRKVADAMDSLDYQNVQVEGHTDSTGSPAANRQLSQARAENVRAYLMNLNDLSDSEITAVGYGDERPVGNNRTPAGRAMNRRIDIVIATVPR